MAGVVGKCFVYYFTWLAQQLLSVTQWDVFYWKLVWSSSQRLLSECMWMERTINFNGTFCRSINATCFLIAFFIFTSCFFFVNYYLLIKFNEFLLLLLLVWWVFMVAATTKCWILSIGDGNQNLSKDKKPQNQNQDIKAVEMKHNIINKNILCVLFREPFVDNNFPIFFYETKKKHNIKKIFNFFFGCQIYFSWWFGKNTISAFAQLLNFPLGLKRKT